LKNSRTLFEEEAMMNKIFDLLLTKNLPGLKSNLSNPSLSKILSQT
jgi:hypothetical protein